MSEGFLDTNLFLHARVNDRHTTECRAFLAALESGQVQARLDFLVVPELTYTLPRLLKQMTRFDIAEYLLTVLAWEGVLGDKNHLIDVIERWRDTPKLGFVDAYLAARSVSEEAPIYSKNLRALHGQGALVPNPLPAG